MRVCVRQLNGALKWIFAKKLFIGKGGTTLFDIFLGFQMSVGVVVIVSQYIFSAVG